MDKVVVSFAVAVTFFSGDDGFHMSGVFQNKSASHGASVMQDFLPQNPS